jgi:uncharacterized membrane protein YcfT
MLLSLPNSSSFLLSSSLYHITIVFSCGLSEVSEHLAHVLDRRRIATFFLETAFRSLP